jgi:hypothetical protein
VRTDLVGTAPPSSKQSHQGDTIMRETTTAKPIPQEPDVVIAIGSSKPKFTAVTPSGRLVLNQLMGEINAEGQSTGWNGTAGEVVNSDGDYVYQTCLIASLIVQMPDGSLMGVSPEDIEASLLALPAGMRQWLRFSTFDPPQ